MGNFHATPGCLEGSQKTFRGAPLHFFLLVRENPQGVLVFQEPHSNGSAHYHCVLVAKTKTKCWSRMADLLADDKLKCDVRVVHAGKEKRPF